MAEKQNFYATRLATDIGAGDTNFAVETVPVVTSGRLVLEARNPTQREIISFSGVSGNQLTGVMRGQGGTTAKPHLKNALVEMNMTAEDLDDLYDLFDTGSVLINTAKLARFVAGAGVPDSVGVLGDEKYYTTVGTSTWTKPEGLKFVIVEVQGAGGGGGGCGSTGSGQMAIAGGGGAGGYSRKKILATDLGATETITVGTRGTRGSNTTNAGNGSQSSFGSHCSANGGQGGESIAGANISVGAVAIAGSGGTASGGDFNLTGNHSVPGSSSGTDGRGVMSPGANSQFGAGGLSQRNGGFQSSATGNNATGYGSGGSGATRSQSQSGSIVGGHGAHGIVIVREFF